MTQHHLNFNHFLYFLFLCMFTIFMICVVDAFKILLCSEFYCFHVIVCTSCITSLTLLMFLISYVVLTFLLFISCVLQFSNNFSRSAFRMCLHDHVIHFCVFKTFAITCTCLYLHLYFCTFTYTCTSKY